MAPHAEPFRAQLDRLLSAYGVSSEGALVVETCKEDWVDGRLGLEAGRFVDANHYQARWDELRGQGFEWLNLSYYGRLRGCPLLVIELPARSVAAIRTSVNFSGPCRAVVEAGGDAAVVVSVRGC